jgi:hypothetical protein
MMLSVVPIRSERGQSTVVTSSYGGKSRQAAGSMHNWKNEKGYSFEL